jgi:hypothetical protein
MTATRREAYLGVPPRSTPMADSGRVGDSIDRLRVAEDVLRRLGYAKVPPAPRVREPDASFWVQEAGVPRRTYPVYVPAGDRSALTNRIDRWLEGLRGAHETGRRAIFVAPNDAAAEDAWSRLAGREGTTIEHEVSILVVPPSGRSEPPPHFHLRTVPPREVLRVATGVVVGLFRRAHALEASNQIDFEEMLNLLRARFGIDVHASLGVRSDEDALFLLYQLALRDSYAPGDAGANVHLLVLKPTGPAARLPWFAA